jgi:type I restriction enzyme S subunit
MSAALTQIVTEKQLVPELRFNEFDGDWEEKRLGEIADVTKLAGFEYTKHIVYRNEGKIIALRGLNIKNNTLDLNKVKYIDDSDFKKLNRSKLFIGDLLYTYVGTIGEVAIIEENDRFYLAPNVSRIRFNEDECLAKIAIQYFTNPVFKEREVGKYISSSSQPALSMTNIRKFKITLPSTQEQQKIASFLSAVDEKIQQLTKKKALLEQYKKGVMQQLFSGQLRFKDENGKTYPDWEEKRLGEVLTIGSGRDHKHLEFGDIPVFGTGGYMRSVNKKLYSGETVFIGRKGTIDKPFYFDGDFWTVDTLFYTHKFKNVLPKFIYAIFQQVNWKLHNEASGVPSLSKSTIEKIKFDFPIIEEQQKIARYLSSIDTKIESVNNQITQTQTFKKGLLQQMFV